MVGLTTVHFQSINRIDRLPVWPRGSAQRVHAEFEVGAANGVDVHDILEIANVGQDEIFLVGASRGADGFLERNALYIFVSRPQ